METIQSLGADLGYGNTKNCFRHPKDNTIICRAMPSCIVEPKQTGLATIGMKGSHPVTSVTLGNKKYMVGENAWLYGEPTYSMDYTALSSLETRAKFFGNFGECCEPGEYLVKNLTIGLPVDLLMRKEEIAPILEDLKSYKAAHHFSVNGKDYVLKVENLKVLAQPVGGYMNWLMDDNGHIRQNKKRGEIAIIDCGANTLDMYVIKDGIPSDRFIGGNKSGVRRLLNRIDPQTSNLFETDAALRMNLLKVPADDRTSWQLEVLGVIEQTLPSLKRFDEILLVGGGINVLGQPFRTVLMERGARITISDDPVTANAKGLYKFGCH